MLSKLLRSYHKHVAGLKSQHDEKRAMELAVGGEFEALGRLEHYLLLHYGLQPHHTIVDVGCGSGRLPARLKDVHKGRYVGIDVVPALYEYARKICARPDWVFKQAPGLTIPEPDGSADFICFFSVFTHLTHEESYRYLQDAARVLKPGGRIVFSFFEFGMPSHWGHFQYEVVGTDTDVVHNQFMSRDGIEAWAAHIGLRILEFVDGEKRFIKLPEPIKFENGIVHEDFGHLGQSICLVTKD
jgi:SAM-dependent methyltransferase